MPGAASASVRDLTPPRGGYQLRLVGGVQKKVGVLTPVGGVEKSLQPPPELCQCYLSSCYKHASFCVATRYYKQGHRQVKICGVDRHTASAERMEPTGESSPNLNRADPYPSPCKNSSDLNQFQERPLAKVGWTCPSQSTPRRRHCT